MVSEDDDSFREVVEQVTQRLHIPENMRNRAHNAVIKRADKAKLQGVCKEVFASAIQHMHYARIDDVWSIERQDRCEWNVIRDRRVCEDRFGVNFVWDEVQTVTGTEGSKS